MLPDKVIKVTAPDGPVVADVKLPASKSISNRVLIIRALCGTPFQINNLSEASDTVVLSQLLSSPATDLHCGEGGTTLRFILAYLSLKGGSYRITGAPSLVSRPLEPLLKALGQLGCSFTFEDKPWSLPLEMSSSGLRSSKILELPGDISSQFISALMLVGPYVSNGITIRMTGEVLSYPYISMTAKVMASFGVRAVFINDTITVSPGSYSPPPVPYTVEPDWSAASYWYEIAALRPGSEVRLKGLMLDSLQGDVSVASNMKELGVMTLSAGDDIILNGTHNHFNTGVFVRDLSGCPDTAPALIAACAGLGVTADFPGLKNFRLKETDRAAAFQRELYNFNINTDFCGGSKFKVYGDRPIRPSERIVKTYCDHRVAMAMTPLSLVAGPVLIDDPGVVSKSYPGYFDDLIAAGFRVEDFR